MSDRTFPRGSEWRVWDLHVHSPYSELRNGFGSDVGQWIRLVIERAVEKEVAAIGVTDYFLVDGYEALRDFVRTPGNLESILPPDKVEAARGILLLPNIELRGPIVRTATDEGRVNFHVLFDDSLDISTIREHFLRELKFTSESAPSSGDERWSLTKTNLEDLGRRLKAEHSGFTGSDLFHGMANAIVDPESVTKVLEEQRSRFEGRYLVSVAADEDLSKISWNSHGHLARKLYVQKSHFLFSANEGTRLFALGGHKMPDGSVHYDREAFVREFKSLKPCLHGSDAHEPERLFEPERRRYTWMKADPTWLGLLQVMTEPDGRVFIGPKPRALETLPLRTTRVIDRVRVQRALGSSLKERWFDVDLPLNPEFVAVIGNKGSGKSALADIIGLAGSTRQTSSFSFLTQDRFRSKKDGKAAHFEASLIWRDGTLDGPLRLDRDPAESAQERVKYVPQGYLEEICNEFGAGKGSGRLDSELEEVIFSHIPFAERQGKGSLQSLLRHIGEEISRSIALRQLELASINGEVLRAQSQAHPAHRARLEAQAAARQRDLDAHEAAKPTPVLPPTDSDDDQAGAEVRRRLIEVRKKFSDASELLERLLAEDAALSVRVTQIERVIGALENAERAFISSISAVAGEISGLGLALDDIVKLAVDVEPLRQMQTLATQRRDVLGNPLDPAGVGAAENALDAAGEELEQLRAELAEPQQRYETYLAQLAEWEQIRQGIIGAPGVAGSYEDLKAQLEDLSDLPRRLKTLSKDRLRAIAGIYAEKQLLRNRFASYHRGVQAFLDTHPIARSEGFQLAFATQIVEKGAADALLVMIDQRRAGALHGSADGRAVLADLIDKTDWNNARSVFRFVRRVLGVVEFNNPATPLRERLKSDVSEQEFLDLLTGLSYLEPVYQLTWDGRGLDELSPGERGNLLLIFYLLVDRSDIPLVIDQPEENLDNQTVVRTLVPCIRDAKVRRQIILVTHNPNLAVVCDASQVVHASISRDGTHSVRYSSGSIEDPSFSQHLVDVLEGTKAAFDTRDSKYEAGRA